MNFFGIYIKFFFIDFYNDKILILFLLILVCRGLLIIMKINIFLSMVFVGFVVLKIVIMVYILCGYNFCVCDDKG